ncbi:hypothetical protein INT43_001962 [Umbelopsis isabellina]|uniref:Altered inheritance of mitochondria protein 24, mitochondrial n=1 Tax=Mortierella isabellina TaxID=91625 RepID=A0A8H7PRT3_MORIS|nr:hypothetical protein INT43_001962 [Umbelopsis isabellina]
MFAAIASPGKSEPEFNIVSSGVGSLLMVKLPPHTDIVAATGTAVGSSNKVLAKLTMDGGSISAGARRVLGDSMFRQKFETHEEYGDVLLSPASIGEIAIIKINGSTEYAMRRDTFLAKTSRVSVDLGFGGIKGKETGLVQRIAHKVRGPGTIAISHYGGLYRVVLDEGEEYLANPSHLVAWDTRTEPTKLYTEKRTIPSPRSRLRRYHVFRNIVDSPSMQNSLQFWDSVFKHTRNWILGAPDFVRLKGPGDFYLSSRVEPRYVRSKLLNAITQADDSVDQAMTKASIFPTALAPAKEPTKPRFGYATEKSKDGAITYYASIDNKGQVSFVPARQIKLNSAEENATS